MEFIDDVLKKIDINYTNMMVSSANSSMVEFIPNGISFIKIQNRLGYMSAPCGTTGA
jgi:hypothetical protein